MGGKVERMGKRQMTMDKISAKGMAILSGLVSLLFAVLAVASAFRRDGASSLVAFSFAYIMYDVTRGLINEGKDKAQ